MTNEEFQKLILDKLATVATKDDIKQLKDDIAVLDSKIDLLAQGSQEDVKSMIRLTDKKIDRIDTKIDILNNHLLEHETDIQLLKKA
ncbi:MAG TPA: hypothetical protein VGK06_10110 [Methanosarcina sp.]|jgi:low affinity Fe/Cu permease